MWPPPIMGDSLPHQLQGNFHPLRTSLLLIIVSFEPLLENIAVVRIKPDQAWAEKRPWHVRGSGEEEDENERDHNGKEALN